MTHALRLPGDFSTPEAILDDPGVKRALEAAAKAGFPLTPHLETDPPDLSGLFRREDRAGRFVATSNGSDVNIRLAGSEYRLTAYRDLTLDDASVSFTRGKRSAFSLTRGALVRGTDEGYTTYTRPKSAAPWQMRNSRSGRSASAPTPKRVMARHIPSRCA